MDYLITQLNQHNHNERYKPIAWFTYSYALQNNTTTTLILELHELLCMLSFFVRRFLEKLVCSRQGNVVSIEVKCLQRSDHVLMHAYRYSYASCDGDT